MIQWSEKMSVGNMRIDQQHKTLVESVNKMYEAISRGKGDNVMEETLAKLIAYTKTHFDYEEQFMRQIGFPGLAGHQKIHQNLTEQVQQIAERVKSGKYTSSVSLADLLKNWLMNHILKEDMKYAAHHAASVS